MILRTGFDKFSRKSIIKPESGNKIMKKITKIKPYFDKKGNLFFPKDIKFGGELNPSLNSKEWMFLVLTIADKRHLSGKHIEELFNNLTGSKSSQYKIRHSLCEKGYL